MTSHESESTPSIWTCYRCGTHEDYIPWYRMSDGSMICGACRSAMAAPRCPICQGRGTVGNGMYGSLRQRFTCGACGGTGRKATPARRAAPVLSMTEETLMLIGGLADLAEIGGAS